MVSPYHLLSLFSFLSLLRFSSPSLDTRTITLSLSPFTYNNNHHPWQKLNHLASSSLSRAHQLKNPRLTKIPVFPRSYGGYSISLSFGSPPQTLDFVMDTGSSLVWFPCTHLYICSQCDFPNVDPRNMSTFVPKSSSTAKILGCKDPKCGWLFGSDMQALCLGCDLTSGNCTRNCPNYLIEYGSGTTAGVLLSETLVFSNSSKVNKFVVGCSIFSESQPSGIAGFGRGPESLPAQMGLKKFSYCLISHEFDDTPESSELVLALPNSGNGTAGEVKYTPFLNPLTKDSAFEDYYYVSLRRITIGGAHVKVPYKFVAPGADGNGGAIVDSGTTFTYMDKEIFELVAQEFEKQMVNYSRAKDVESHSGLQPCFDTSTQKKIIFPKLYFQFKSGAKIAFPLADYFSIIGQSSAVCMTIVSSNGIGGPGGSGGPSIIIGNYQQQNFYVEFDLENKRLGFRKQICK